MELSLRETSCSADVIEKYNISSIYYQKEWTNEERIVEKKIINKLSKEINLYSLEAAPDPCS